MIEFAFVTDISNMCIYIYYLHVCMGAPTPISSDNCLLSNSQATMVHLESIKTLIRPKLAISENVAGGNINMRIVEELEGSMESRET